MPLPAMEGALLLPIVSQLLPSFHPSVILSLKGFPFPSPRPPPSARSGLGVAPLALRPDGCQRTVAEAPLLGSKSRF